MGRKTNRHDGWESSDWDANHSDWDANHSDWDANHSDESHFEKINRRQKTALPVSSSKVGGRASKETPGSRKVRRNISQKSGGIHRRRIKKIE